MSTPADGATVQPGTEVSGTAGKGDRVRVAVDGHAVAEATTSPEGTWRTTLPVDLGVGPHKLTATAAGSAGQRSRSSKPVAFTLIPAGASALKAEQTFTPDAQAGTTTVMTVSFTAPKGMPVSADVEQRFVAPTGFRFTGFATALLEPSGDARQLNVRVEDEGRVLVVLNAIRLNLPGIAPAGIDHRTIQVAVSADTATFGSHSDGTVTVGSGTPVTLSGKIHPAS
ncbi:Ig-like domain-containing protein [Amycolatopsis nalaikhensis]|uniref:Ig-like domain-containing protein n=1 Tax=Amycolatopsis nalaikhensis TaxID=715472 RepID=A0ABY8Y2M4_9PSEU|nr:Ig-like domain-containing protein [Amycolatopsis sp. 2-2]WIV62151.1 Ig-like domain-containing protein [Amycolatopsis sp. 2-2]